VIQKREERERILAAYDESALTQRAFAKREGVKYSVSVRRATSLTG
jgi:transposase